MKSKKPSSPSVITDKLRDELDARWLAYKNQTERVFTFEQVKKAARQKVKSGPTK